MTDRRHILQEAETALEPFATEAGTYSDADSNSDEVSSVGGLTVGDLRNAARVLARIRASLAEGDQDHSDSRAKLAAIIARQDEVRGRPLTATEKFDNLRRELTTITEAERLADKDKDSIRARIQTEIGRALSWETIANTTNHDLRAGALGALSEMLTAIEPWLAHRFDDKEQA